MSILVTGCAGFIGMHTSLKLINEGLTVVGVDNLNDYYNVDLKRARLSELNSHSENFTFYKYDLVDKESLSEIFNDHHIEGVIHLAAQAGVRYSIENPQSYIDSNITGFLNILELCRHNPINHLVYASSSSVYGGNTNYPFKEKDSVDHPISLYAASKKSNELMAHTYSHLFSIPTSGLRFFTVYGPWGRPDMALFLFAEAITKNKPIKVFNNGNMIRDFTYIDDIVEGVVGVYKKPAIPNKNFNSSEPNPGSSNAPYRIFNIGNNNPVSLMDYIGALEKHLGMKAKKDFLPIQPGDVAQTSSDTNELNNWIDFKPNTSIDFGISKFVDWYLSKYKKL